MAEESSMRFVSLVPAAVALFVAGAAYAQTWDVYTNRGEFFAINLPGEPKMTTSPYRTAKGTSLTAKKYMAVAPAGSILAGTYTLTVVDYNSAKGELGTAIEEAAARFRGMGKVTYDAVNMLDNHRSWRQTIENANQRILTEILVAKNSRLYISEAVTALNIPPPAQFQASLQILDENGARIRLQTAELAQSAAANEVIPVTPAQVAERSAELAGLVTGTWRLSTGGSCQSAYFKSAERAKTKRNEEALAGTVTSQGMTVTGQLILAGAREGQFINPMTDKAVFLLDTLPNSQLGFTPIGEPVLGWPEVKLDRCTG
jgi:hypothetical protein